MKPKIEKKLSLSKQLHLGEPVVIHEEQEAVQQTSELKVATPAQKAADEKQIPKADKIAAKKSITTETPTNIIIEVHFVYSTLAFNISYFNVIEIDIDSNSYHINYTGYRTNGRHN